MNSDAGASKSLWMDTLKMDEFFPLLADAECDVCVIGAGVAGLSTAYSLTKAGYNVMVLDDGRVGGGETERTSGHLSNVLDNRYYQIEKWHGKEKARAAYESQSYAIDTIEWIIANEGIDCDFQRLPGYLFSINEESVQELSDELKREREALVSMEVGNYSFENWLPLPSAKPIPYIKFEGQAQLHALKYLRGLARAIVAYKGRIYTGCHVTDIVDGEKVEIKIAHGPKVKAKYLVVATNSPISDLVKVHTKQAAYRTYVIASEVPLGSVPPALYWDTNNPYHYVRLGQGKDAEHEMLIVGGEDHKTGQESPDVDPYARLEAWARNWFPAFGNVDYKWSGQIYQPVDGLGFIGFDPAHGKNIFITTGGGGLGLTHGALSGVILRDLIVNKYNPWAELYNPSRMVVRSIGEYVKENVNTAVQYARNLETPQYSSSAEVPLGHGGIAQDGPDTIAAYRDDYGHLHKFSPVCPHMKARLCWNECEKSWDCPAHGSRFTANGEVIDGPANSNMLELNPEPGPDYDIEHHYDLKNLNKFDDHRPHR